MNYEDDLAVDPSRATRTTAQNASSAFGDEEDPVDPETGGLKPAKVKPLKPPPVQNTAPRPMPGAVPVPGQLRMAPQQPPPEPPPFTQADTLQLQRLQQGTAAVSKELYDGKIDQPTHDAYMQQLQGQIAPLQARQKAQQAQAQQEQQQAVLHQNAQQQMVKTMNAQHNAETFPQTVATFVDPVSGHTAHMVQNHRGDWEELKFERDGEKEQRLFDNPPDKGSVAPSQNLAASQQGQAGPEGEGAAKGAGAQQYEPPTGIPWNQYREVAKGTSKGAGALSDKEAAAMGNNPETGNPWEPVARGMGKHGGEGAGAGKDMEAEGIGMPHEKVEPINAPREEQPPLTLGQMAEQARQPAPEQAGTPPAAPQQPGAPQIITGGAVPRLGQDLSQFHWNPKTQKMEQEGWNGTPRNRGIEQEIMERARRAVGAPPRPTGNAHFDLHQQQLHQQRISDLAHQMIGNHYRHEEHKDLQKAAHQEHVRGEQSKSEERQRQEKAQATEHQRQEQERRDKAHADRAEKEAKVKEVSDSRHLEGIKHYRDVIGKAREKWLGNPLNKEADLPEHLKQENEGKEASKKYMEDLGQLGVIHGKPKEEAMPTGGLKPEFANLPSTQVGRSKIKELLPILDGQIASIPTDKRTGDKPEKLLFDRLKEMRALVKKADEQGHMTLGQGIEYEDHHKALESLLQQHGARKGAPDLRLVSPPVQPGASPAQQTGQVPSTRELQMQQEAEAERARLRELAKRRM